MNDSMCAVCRIAGSSQCTLSTSSLAILFRNSAMPNRNERRKRCSNKEDYDIWKINKSLRHEQHKLERMEKKAIDDEQEMSLKIQMLKEDASKAQSSSSNESQSIIQQPVGVPIDKYISDLKAKLNM